MAAIDKLHKIYSSNYEPLVWARSVGVEVLNEFDSVKAAMMMTAGAQGHMSDSATGWAMAAKGVEGLMAGASVAKMVGQRLTGTAAASFNALLGANKDR